MNWGTKIGLAGLLIAGGMTDAFSATAQDSNAARKQPAGLPIDSVIGKKLISIEGSLIAVSASEGGLARDIVAPNGASQRTMFRFLNDRLGTVIDARDSGTVAGVFRVSNSDISIQYADGGTEILFANPGGGISVETKAPQSISYCTAWYPEGYAFSMDERKAALAQYASRLGLAENGDTKADNVARNGCGPGPSAQEAKPEVRADATANPAELAALTAAAMTASLGARKGAEIVKFGKPNAQEAADAAAKLRAVDVRNSKIHVVDESAAVSTAAASPKGATSCLLVENDGGNWGFRNYCDYAVQFAYCLMADSPVGSCKDGAWSGSVGGRRFGALGIDQLSKDGNVANDFRWIACQGNPGEVIARLEETSPPSGRCLPPFSSSPEREARTRP